MKSRKAQVLIAFPPLFTFSPNLLKGEGKGTSEIISEFYFTPAH